MKYLLPAGFLFACMLTAQPEPGTGSIKGQVFNSLTRIPIRKATVLLRAAQIDLVAMTDAAGRFEFTGLPPGTYRLFASQAGYFEHRRPVTLGPGDRVSDAEIRLAPQGAITGRVLDEDDDPMAGARLSLFKQVYENGQRRWDPINGTVANEAGEYRFGGLRPGRYLLQAENQLRPTVNNHYGIRDRKAMEYVPAYHPSAATQRAASPVELGVGAEVRGIDIHLFRLPLPPSFRLSGSVTGAPAGSEISVGLSPLDDSRSGGNFVARPPDYTFEMNVRRGQYTIFANEYSGVSTVYAIGSLTVTGELTDIVLPMSPPPEVAAQIKVAGSGSQVNLKGVRVTLSRRPDYPGGRPEARSDAAGRLSFARPIAPGHYSIDVDRRTIPDGCYLEKVKVGGEDIASDDFEILTSTKLEIVLSNTAGTVTGSVAGSDDKPFPTPGVTLIATDGRSRPLRQSTDDDGNFKVAGLRPGKYQLFAWEEVDDALWQDPDFRKKYESRATEITVGPSETQNVQLRSIRVEEMK